MLSPQAITEQEGLRYVSDSTPGITRRKCGRGFAYFDTQGKRLTEVRTLARIRSLAIPPAYTNVWICPHGNGHIQATGFDSKGRKQYRYHARWREVRDANKFEQVLRFGSMLSLIRRHVAEDMKLPGLPREKVLATVVSLLDKTLIRIGNAEYARTNGSYGLTTLRKKHIAVNGHTIRFEFTGKSGKHWQLAVSDRRIASVVKRCADIPGYELFQYLDDNGMRRQVGSADVNDYLKSITGDNFTAKDFRTWAGTVLAATSLCASGYECETQAKKTIVAVTREVARRLGNTPAICRKSYIYPEVLVAYADGELEKLADQQLEAEFRREHTELSEEECRVLALLQRRASIKARTQTLAS